MDDDVTSIIKAAQTDPVSVSHAPRRAVIHAACMTLETRLQQSEQDKILLLLEQDLLLDFSLFCLEQLLKRYQRFLVLLASPSEKAHVVEAIQASQVEDGRRFPERFRCSLTDTPQIMQVCVATVREIQCRVKYLAFTQPFFRAFDAVLLYPVPPQPGPGWIRIVELFTQHARIIGLSETLSDEGMQSFGEIVDARR